MVGHYWVLPDLPICLNTVNAPGRDFSRAGRFHYFIRILRIQPNLGIARVSGANKRKYVVSDLCRRCPVEVVSQVTLCLFHGMVCSSVGLDRKIFVYVSFATLSSCMYLL